MIDKYPIRRELDCLYVNYSSTQVDIIKWADIVRYYESISELEEMFITGFIEYICSPNANKRNEKLFFAPIKKHYVIGETPKECFANKIMVMPDRLRYYISDHYGGYHFIARVKDELHINITIPPSNGSPLYIYFEYAIELYFRDLYVRNFDRIIDSTQKSPHIINNDVLADSKNYILKYHLISEPNISKH
jgi:hypothetical protein